MENEKTVGVVLLAAGYGTRLARDLHADKAFESLASTPKPLLPVGGRVLLDHWVAAFLGIRNLSAIVIVTNAIHESLYAAWAKRIDTGSFNVKVISDGSSTNETRLGAVAAMRLGIEALPDAIDVGLIVAGDTLLPGVDIQSCLQTFISSESSIAIFGYELIDRSDCVRRGMLKFGEGNECDRVVALIEKPSSPELAPSNCAAAPVYALARPALSSISSFLEEAVRDGVELEKRDAPGFWLAWAIPRFQCMILRIATRVDIGGLEHYKQALVDYTGVHGDAVLPPLKHEVAVGRAWPRVGILGNPSDGYGGKCIAAAIESEGLQRLSYRPHIEK
jgi:dTDP-glucose pyrophosphorylase